MYLVSSYCFVLYDLEGVEIGVGLNCLSGCIVCICESCGCLKDKIAVTYTAFTCDIHFS